MRVCQFPQDCQSPQLHGCMQDLGNSLYFFAGQSQILAALFRESSFFFNEVVQLVKSFKWIIDLVRKGRDSMIGFCRRWTILQPLILPGNTRRNNYTFAPHDTAPFLVRYQT